MQERELIKRLARHYYPDLILATIFLIISLIFVYDAETLISAIARKIALTSAGLVYYYITRYTKIGQIEWRDPYDKIYSLAILLYTALVFAFG
jgi:hypothetical protein